MSVSHRPMLFWAKQDWPMRCVEWRWWWWWFRMRERMGFEWWTDEWVWARWRYKEVCWRKKKKKREAGMHTVKKRVSLLKKCVKNGCIACGILCRMVFSVRKWKIRRNCVSNSYGSVRCFRIRHGIAGGMIKSSEGLVLRVEDGICKYEYGEIWYMEHVCGWTQTGE